MGITAHDITTNFVSDKNNESNNYYLFKTHDITTLD